MDEHLAEPIVADDTSPEAMLNNEEIKDSNGILVATETTTSDEGDKAAANGGEEKANDLETENGDGNGCETTPEINGGEESNACNGESTIGVVSENHNPTDDTNAVDASGSGQDVLIGLPEQDANGDNAQEMNESEQEVVAKNQDDDLPVAETEPVTVTENASVPEPIETVTDGTVTVEEGDEDQSAPVQSSHEPDNAEEETQPQEAATAPLPSPPQTDDPTPPPPTQSNAETESILVELQASLQNQMQIRAEVENQLRNQAAEIERYKKKLDEYSDMEDRVEHMTCSLTQVIAEKTHLEQEVGKLRDGRDDLEQKEAVLSNRLNDAKKKEASKSNEAERLERENEELKHALDQVKGELKSVKAQKDKLENSMDKLKKKCVDRVKMAEAALVEERNLNEERKKKMKVFVETKAEDLRSSKTANDELRTELKETSGALQSVRGKLEHMTQQYEHASTKNREVTRDMNRMKKNSEQLHQLGGNLELELQQAAQETEEHKNKRLTAKHELMTILRKLEAEQTVSGKLRDSVKFTFTPKALSQQQLLDESLQDFESELLKLSRRLGKPLPPSTHPALRAYGDENVSDENGEGQNGNGNPKANSRSEWDTARLLSSLENETQQVSKGIMAFSSAVERLHTLLDTSGEKTCVNTLNELFNVMAVAKENNLDGAVAALPSNQSVSYDEEEDGSFAGTPVKRGTSQRYGLVDHAVE